jgi:hypothetical protein
VPVLGSRVPVGVMYSVAGLMWVVVIAYVGLSRLLGTVRLFGHVIALPGFRMALLQVLLATVDVGVTAAIFYALLPDEPGLSYLRFLGIYLASYTAGLVANLPGGLGVFDTAMLLGLAPYLAPPEIIGAILIFRLYYYIIPLFLAGGLFAGNEVLLRGRGILKSASERPGVQAIGRWSQPDFVVAAATGAVALCGALLILVGLLEDLGEGSGWTNSFYWIVGEMNEFTPSLLGATLVVLAAGMTLRVKLAWSGSLAVLIAGAVFLALHAAPVWMPATLLATCGVLAPFHRAFYRPVHLFSGKLRTGTVLPLAVLVICAVALAGFEPRLAWLDSNSFWEVILSPEVPRTMRASLAAFVALGLFALWRLLLPARPQFDPWDAAAAARLAALGGRAPVGAEGIVWGEDGTSAIAFRRIGRVLLALGDPVGDTGDRVSAVWCLRDLARQEGRNPAVWQAGRDLLEVYGDIGLTALPLGPDNLPVADAEDAPGPHAERYLVCVAEHDLPVLLPILLTLPAV